jgi:hypothetical protein
MLLLTLLSFMSDALSRRAVLRGKAVASEFRVPGCDLFFLAEQDDLPVHAAA